MSKIANEASARISAGSALAEKTYVLKNHLILSGRSRFLMGIGASDGLSVTACKGREEGRGAISATENRGIRASVMHSC